MQSVLVAGNHCPDLIMAKRKSRPRDPAPARLPRVRLNGREWRRVIDVLRLSGQQARIVALVLQAKSDKQIAAELDLRLPTVRTYLRRLYQRSACTNRVGLVLRIFACLREPADPAP